MSMSAPNKDRKTPIKDSVDSCTRRELGKVTFKFSQTLTFMDYSSNYLAFQMEGLQVVSLIPRNFVLNYNYEYREY